MRILLVYDCCLDIRKEKNCKEHFSHLFHILSIKGSIVNCKKKKNIINYYCLVAALIAYSFCHVILEEYAFFHIQKIYLCINCYLY